MWDGCGIRLKVTLVREDGADTLSFFVSVEHRFVNQVLRKIEAVNGRILEKNFDMDADFDVEIPEDLAETFAKELEELTRGALLIEFVEE